MVTQIGQRRLALVVLLVGFALQTTAFVVLIHQNVAKEGYVVFDANVEESPNGNFENRNFENSGAKIQNFSNYVYRVSHHKTHPWAHRLVTFDKSGKLRLKRALDSCYYFESSFSRNSFLVYIDIIAQQFHNGMPFHSGMSAIHNGMDSTIHNTLSPNPYPFDYISFPLMIIVEPSQSCSSNQVQRSGASAEIKAHDKDILHWTRSVDDMYVSIPVEGDFCHHASERIGNLEDFMPLAVRNQCHLTANSDSTSDHFFGVEGKTNDVVLRADFCLFEQFHTSEILIRLNCFPNKEERKNLVSWDQLVHLIIHRLGPASSLKSNNVNDESHFERHPIHRIRREMRNQAPYFDQTLYKVSVPEELPAGITVTTISATDPENSPISYSMTSLLDSRSQHLFSVDSKSGIVTTSEKLDREQMDNHYFRIVATDSGLPPRTGTATLEINVGDTNDHEPKFEQSSYSISIREGISVGSTVISLRARDEDSGKNGELFYSILNPHDIDDAFRIDPNSGVITTKLPLDREKRAEYTILVQANDLALSQLDRKAATTTCRVEIIDENDNYPHFTSKAYSVSVPENFDVSNYPVIARVSATDADEGVNAALRYSIIGGNSQNHFSIDSLSGEVSLIKSIDYEATRNFRLNIRAIDSGNPSRSNSTQLLVSVEDRNDNPPKFFQSIFQETVPENLPIGSSAIKIQAFDADDELNAKLQYKISNRDNSEKFPFEIDSNTGWILTTQNLDREEQNRFDFSVIASDSAEQPLSSTASVVILVSDVNDNDPIFLPKIYEATISEQDPPGTPVETVKATDPDENSRLMYEITEGNTRNRFSISTQNGEGRISIAQPLDFKLERKFVLVVKATDNGGRFDLATVYIEVLDSNSNAPVFQSTPYSVKIFEDVPLGTTVLTVVATDADSGQNAQIVYTFVQDGDNEGYDDFMIDSTTGAITTIKLLDREKVPGYILTVNARDKGIPPLSDTTDVEIVLNDVNDLSPQFERDFYQTKVSEDVPIGTSVLQVQASDGDQGRNSIVRYSFSTFSDGDGTFSVDSASGIIRTVKALDRETVSRYELVVLATDQGSPELTGKTNVKIDVLDVNDNPPMYESDRIRFFIQENSPLGSTVGRLQAYDPDEGPNAVITYSIVGGVDANSFTLVTHQLPNGGDSGTADILTKIESLDFESKRKKFDIIVRASSPPLRNDVHVEIHVQDVNDNGPVLKPFEIILNNYKDHFPVGPIGRVPASDADITDQLQYSILSGNKANLIYLNETTGLITLSPYLDTNVPLTAKMEILVSDGLNEVRAEMTLQTRMITDELLFNSIGVQLLDMTTEAFLSPLFPQFHQALAVALNSPKENIVIFSVQEEIEDARGVLNVSFAARKPNSAAEEYFSPDYIKERVFLNRFLLSKLSTVEILPFADDLCLLEPCPNFEDCLSVLRFRNTTNFFSTDTMLFRSVLPWQTFACRCPSGFTGLREHYLCDAEVNLCFSSPCHNGGTCFRKERGFSCACPPDFTGAHCEIQTTLDTCQPNICSRGSNCFLKIRGGFHCQNCSVRGDYVNDFCELSARSFYRGAYLTFPGLKNRYRLNIQLDFATQQRNGLLLYNGRYNEKFDFIALEIVNSTVRFSFSLGSVNVTQVGTGKAVSDGLWHHVEVNYFNKTAMLRIDDCDAILHLDHPDEFPASKSCAGRSSQVLDRRCDLFTESCQRFMDLTGPLYIGGLPGPSSSFQVEAHSFLGCIKNVLLDHKFLDLNSYVKEHGTVAGCPEKKSFCALQPCKNGGKCVEVWGTFRCHCADGFGQKDCSEDSKPIWNLRSESSFLMFSPPLKTIQFPWYNSLSVRTLKQSGALLSVTLSNNETVMLTMENNGILHYTLDGNKIPLSLPRVNDGHWHNIEVKWMTAEIWFSLDYGQHEITVQYEAKLQNLYVSQVLVGGPEEAFDGCVQDVRVGTLKSYLRKPSIEKSVSEGCNLATACIGATCPPRSTCVEEGGRHKCRCDAGYVGTSCLPICDLRPCKNNGTCAVDLSSPKGYTCRCDDRLYRGPNCEELLDLTCPSTWWNTGTDCAPCSCPADRNFSPECNKKSGQCKCKEYHYEKDGSCRDCLCYSEGSISKNCDIYSGKCQCRSGVSGSRCDSCNNPFAEVTSAGCEIVEDGCPKSFTKDIWWPRSKFGSTAIHECPSGAIGLATRECVDPRGWEHPDVFNCTSTSLISILNVIAQLDSNDLLLSPLLSTKLAFDLQKALNSSKHLYGNDLWVSLRLLRHLIRCELEQKGLYLSHRQDKNFIRDLALSTSRITSKEYAAEWTRIRDLYNVGSDTLLKIMEDYLAQLTLNQEDTYTRPFEIITPNMVLGLDTVELTWENKDRKNFEDLELKSSYDLYEVSTVKKRAVRFPKYDNIVMDPRRYTSNTKIIIPLDVLGLNEEKEMAGNAVVGYVEYSSLWDILPKRFKSDVDRRFNSQLIAHSPVITLSILASRTGLRTGKQSSPIRISYELFGRYIDSSNPQCVIWEEPTDDMNGGWTTRPCSTQAQETYVAHRMGNVMTVNCTCWHLSTFALLIENNATQDIPRPHLLEDIVTYLAFVFALVLIFGALVALGLLKGPVPSTITNTIHKHLLFNLFISLLLYLVGLKLRLILVLHDIPCRLLAVGLHFFWLSSFAWLFGSSLLLRRMFTEVRDVNHGSALIYYALGYAFPLLCVALSLGVRAHHYGNKFFCWLSLYEGIVWGMVGPILLCVFGSLFTFLIAIRAAFTLKDSVIDSGSMRTLLWMDLTLLPIVGSVWTLSLLGSNERSPLWQYAISTAVTLLGLYVALGYCILNQRVKDSLYITAGNLFKTKEDLNVSNVSRSALAYRSESRVDDLRRDIFLGVRSMGVSTASTTSRSTTKTSSSPFRAETLRPFGAKSATRVQRLVKGNHSDIPDSPRKVYQKRKKRSSEEDEATSDGDHTLELASSHSSDEDEAIPPDRGRGATIAINGYGTYRLLPGLVSPPPATSNRRSVSASLSTLHVPPVKLPALPRLYSTNWTPNISSNTNGHYREMRQTVGGRSSGNSGSDNENSNGIPPPPDYLTFPKMLNSSENLHQPYLGGQVKEEPKYGEKLPFLFQESVNDLSASTHPMSPLHSFSHLTSTPLLPYHLSVVSSRQMDSPISPVQEITDETVSSEHERKPGDEGQSPREGISNPGLIERDERNDEEIYGGSITSGVLV